MNLGLLITARLNSSRLPQKHLQNVSGRPILQTLIDRIKREFAAELGAKNLRIFISTGNEEPNRALARNFPGVEVFYGSPQNIPFRHLQNLKAHGLAAAVSVDGDDILCSTIAMRRVYECLRAGHDLAKTDGLPLGMNASGYTLGLLESSLRTNNPEVLETGWGRIFAPSNPRDISLAKLSENELLRFTLDYPADLDFFRAVIEHFGAGIDAVSDEKLVAAVEAHEFNKLNESVAREYWVNFHRQVSDEKAKELEKGV